MDYLSSEEEELMMAALDRVERLERAKKQQAAFREKWAARQRPERSEEGGMAGEPSQSNQFSPTSEKLEEAKLRDEGVARKRRNPENEFDVSCEDEEEQNAARESHPNPGKGSNLKHHMRPGGSCAAKRQRLEEVPDRSGEPASGEQSGSSTVTTGPPYESSTESENSRIESVEANRSVVEDRGLEIGGGEDNRENDVLKEDPIAITEEVRREMRDMMCDMYEKNWGAIRTHHRRHNRVQDVYNFRLT
ncbi:hypothetical protein HOLleu_20963 [Holothuria leucospilota]|uniref:Uncharacterized protein n=1 Tax=Holothuria leucospilota TaxID=206669 RepID=A0A9Q1BX24_HOLLE|nr:hypothetical protein HOLleu_20963 [Holothuria leucospilota]